MARVLPRLPKLVMNVCMWLCVHVGLGVWGCESVRVCLVESVIATNFPCLRFWISDWCYIVHVVACGGMCSVSTCSEVFSSFCMALSSPSSELSTSVFSQLCQGSSATPK